MGGDYEFVEGDSEEARKDHYTITRVTRLWEISAVDFPAHESSSLEPARNLDVSVTPHILTGSTRLPG